MRIKGALDIDETIMPLVQLFFDDWNAEYGTNYQAEDMDTYEWSKRLGISDEETYAKYHEWTAKLVREFPQKGLRRNFFDGALEALTALNDRYDLHIVTDRSAHVEAETRIICSLLQSEGNCVIPDEKIIETPKYGMNKADFCEQQGIEFIIDDNVKVAQTCREKGIHVYLMRRPWNKTLEQSEFVTPVNNWSEIVKYLL